ncbi:hypothetical protein DPMN_153464 [Dreissena polymorpha]|uniref:Uncharacterized protein n=1 Tax=Dreissena polymorpha TaxID=45954 RepID=A0A9D4FKV3_DREPO|nr:hypothetical protein DPMN_153464 [Dreissena polymorpha]
MSSTANSLLGKNVFTGNVLREGNSSQQIQQCVRGCVILEVQTAVVVKGEEILASKTKRVCINGDMFTEKDKINDAWFFNTWALLSIRSITGIIKKELEMSTD